MGPQSQGGLRSCDIKQRFMMSSFFSVPQGSVANKADHISECCLNQRQENRSVDDTPSAISY